MSSPGGAKFGALSQAWPLVLTLFSLQACDGVASHAVVFRGGGEEGNMSPLKTTAWEASDGGDFEKLVRFWPMLKT